jgi:ligand-binding sensor domain-containing protein
MRFVPIISLIALLSLGALEATPNRLRVYSNTSLTILSIAQGPDGHLWLAANDGVYRFNGFRYDKVPAFPLSSARKIVATRDGSLWISSSEGLVRYSNERFSIVLQDDVVELAAFPDDVVAKLILRDNVRIHAADGTVHRFQEYARRDLTVDSNFRLWFVAGALGTPVWTDLKKPG